MAEGVIVLSLKVLMVLVLSCSFLITYTLIPSIIGVIVKKNLMDNPNSRSSHTREVPTMGGIAFFLTLMISFFFLKSWDTKNVILAIVPGISILFIVGLKDDLVGISPAVKMATQIVACLFVISQDGMSITTFNGFLNINEVSRLITLPISCFLMMMVINAFNLIDGIDGLASITGIVISGIYALMFYYAGEYFFCLLAISTIGILLAFLRYNFSKSTYKIFMGDTGSLVIGFVISVLTIRFLSMPYNSLLKFPFAPEMIPLVVVSILIVPLFDTCRVFLIRIFDKKSPFVADKNHVHHVMTSLGLSHGQTSVIVGFFNVLFVLVFVLLSSNAKSYLPLIFIFIFLVSILVYTLYKLDFRISGLKRKITVRRKINKIKGRVTPKKWHIR